MNQFQNSFSAFQKMTESWVGAFTRLSNYQAEIIRNLLSDLPEAGQRRLDSQTFSQLTRMAKTNWEEELQRMSSIPLDMVKRAHEVDLQRLARLVESTVTEYLHDLQTTEFGALPMDFSGLIETWRKLLTGESTEEACRIAERFIKALSIKSLHGGEFYADPGKVPVGQTPRELVFRTGKIELYRYQPKKPKQKSGSDPLLIVYSLINKSYILDLMPNYSYIQHLLDQGLDVYLIEWGEAEPGDRNTTLDSYIDVGIRECVGHIQKATGKKKVSLFGHCIGGNLAAMYAALYPEDTARLITLTTPVKRNDKGVVALWTNPDVFPIDAIIDAYGVMPAKLIRYTFIAIKPYLEVMKWKMFLENLGNDQIMTYYDYVDTWANDNVDIPGEVYRKYIKEVLLDERFARSETRINRKRVDLKNITCPVLNMAATKDWIVPEESAKPFSYLVGSKESYYITIEGPHVGIMIEPACRPLWDKMTDFMKGKRPVN